MLRSFIGGRKIKPTGPTTRRVASGIFASGLGTHDFDEVLAENGLEDISSEARNGKLAKPAVVSRILSVKGSFILAGAYGAIPIPGFNSNTFRGKSPLSDPHLGPMIVVAGVD
jgi:hypothetical protein